MLEKLPEEYYTLTPFARIPHLLLAYSTTAFGSMNYRDPTTRERREDFFSLLNIDKDRVFTMDQVHSTTIVPVLPATSERFFPRTDGMLTREQGLFLTVVTADCVPITVYDHETGAVGIAHAGWKGTYDGIVPKLIQTFLASGSHVRSLLIGFGPSIRSCCYTIDEKHVQLWKKRYSEVWGTFLSEIAGQMHLSLQDAIIQQLKQIGVREDQITDANVCTKDHEEFYSYRRTHDPSPIGEFVTIIGVVNSFS